MNKKRIVPTVLSAILAGNMIMSVKVSAETINTNKEEVIYINLDGSGGVEGLYAVNIFNDSNIVDYGDYSSIRNMTTEDKLTYSDGEVTGKNSADKLYYEGVLKDTEIPWNISIKYYLDGKEISADKLAGKSGSLEIKMEISQNENCNETFFKNYALQTSLSLNTENCTNIEAEGATVANVGKKKQLSYIIFPEKGADISIKSDVKDFEMDGISINGIKLNLDVDVDTSELTDKVSELTDGIEKLNLGAGALNDGILEVETGLETLNSKSGELTSGSGKVYDALKQMSSTLNSVSVSSDNLTELVLASSNIQNGIDSLVNGTKELQSNVSYSAYKNVMAAKGADIDKLQSGNAEAINNLQNQIASLKQTRESLIVAGGDANSENIKQLDAQIAQFEQVITLLKGNSAVISGTQAYLDTASTGASTLLTGTISLQTNYEQFNMAISLLSSTLNGLVDNISTLSTAINTLTAEYASLDGGINEYAEGVSALSSGYAQIVEGAARLVNGTTELQDRTSNLDGEVNEKVDEVIGGLAGDSAETISFISDRNTNVESVMFVIKTEGIQKEEVEVLETEEETLTVWERFLNLFK